MNPYLDNEPTPAPGPKPKRQVNWQWLVLAIAIAGLFLPSDGCDFGQVLPIPGPAPGPNADETAGAWVVVIEETEDRSPASAKVLSDLKWWQSLEDRGLQWRHYDDDSADAQPYLAYGQPPFVLILGEQPSVRGKVLANEPLPDSTAELDALVEEATGR